MYRTLLQYNQVGDSDLYIRSVVETELRAKHPGLQELADNIIEAQEKYNAFLALVNEEN